MANYIDKYLNIQPTMPVQRTSEPTAVMKPTTPQPSVVQPVGTNVLEKFLQMQSVNAAVKVSSTTSTNQPYKNNLRTMFQNNEATIMGVIIRTLGCKNKVGNELIRQGDERGTFLNAVDRLD